LSFSHDNWAKSLEPLTETGPQDKLSQLWTGAGPYIRQFPSGEVIISYAHSAKMNIAIADGTGKNIGEPFAILNGVTRSLWSATEMLSDHSILAVTDDTYTMPTTGSKFYNITYAPLFLNHRINAPTATPKLDGQSGDWENNTEALFIGSESQAQAAVRAAHDNDNIYFLTERLDEFLTKTGDTLAIYLSDSREGSDFYRLTLDYTGVTAFDKYGEVSSGLKGFTPVSGVEFGASAKGELNKKGNSTDGTVTELSIPKSIIQSSESSSLFVTMTLSNTDNGKKSQQDTLAGIPLDDKTAWIEIKLN
jgi:hypothetical protein